MAQSPEDVLARPIIVLGAPRSGTTFLSLILSHHASLAQALEPRLTWRYGNDRKSDMLRAEDARPQVCSYIRNTFAQLVRDAGRQRLLEKTPSNALRPQFIQAIFPDAKFIHITRNGIDSVLSIHNMWQKHAHGVTGLAPGRISQRLREIQLRRLPYYAKEVLRRMLPVFLAPVAGQNIWGPRIPGIRGLLRDLELLDVCALQWRTCVEISHRFGKELPSNQFMEIRLEDMSPQLMRQILEFCELEDEPNVWEAFEKRYDPSRTRGRRGQADPKDIKQIIRWIAPTMAWLGYELPASASISAV